MPGRARTKKPKKKRKFITVYKKKSLYSISVEVLPEIEERQRIRYKSKGYAIKSSCVDRNGDQYGDYVYKNGRWQRRQWKVITKHPYKIGVRYYVNLLDELSLKHDRWMGSMTVHFYENIQDVHSDSLIAEYINFFKFHADLNIKLMKDRKETNNQTKPIKMTSQQLQALFQNYEAQDDSDSDLSSEEESPTASSNHLAASQQHPTATTLKSDDCQAINEEQHQIIDVEQKEQEHQMDDVEQEEQVHQVMIDREQTMIDKKDDDWKGGLNQDEEFFHDDDDYMHDMIDNEQDDWKEGLNQDQEFFHDDDDYNHDMKHGVSECTTLYYLSFN